MNVEDFVHSIGADFYTGVPDSQLKPLCDYLMDTYGIDAHHHIIAANEGNCTALAAGYYISTGRVPVVYLQNSGEGNIVNPVESLLNEHVYAVPVIFIVGWRGEPGVQDEPQHISQGALTVQLLEEMGIRTFILDRDTSLEDLRETMAEFRVHLSAGKSVAFVVRKCALSYDGRVSYQNEYTMRREDILRHIVNVSCTDPVIVTTGKAGRELFEIRKSNNQSNQYDFLSVGSMGHASSIALGIALQKKSVKIWCIDGDGAVLMHMGALALIGSQRPENLVHIVINNESHESVGGMPTIAKNISLTGIARECGYPYAVSVDSFEQLDAELQNAKERNALTFLEIKCAIGARSDLGRPTISTLESRKIFMQYLSSL